MKLHWSLWVGDTFCPGLKTIHQRQGYMNQIGGNPTQPPPPNRINIFHLKLWDWNVSSHFRPKQRESLCSFPVLFPLCRIAISLCRFCPKLQKMVPARVCTGSHARVSCGHSEAPPTSADSSSSLDWHWGEKGRAGKCTRHACSNFCYLDFILMNKHLHCT